MICEDAIDAMFPPHIERKLGTLCDAALRCGQSICKGNRPRLIFETIGARQQFIKATGTLSQNDALRAWLRDSNPRLSVYHKAIRKKRVASINFNEIRNP